MNTSNKKSPINPVVKLNNMTSDINAADTRIASKYVKPKLTGSNPLINLKAVTITIAANVETVYITVALLAQYFHAFSAFLIPCLIGYIKANAKHVTYKPTDII